MSSYLSTFRTTLENVSRATYHIQSVYKWFVSVFFYILYASLTLISDHGAIVAVVIFTAIIIIVAVVYIRYPFWSRQPVLHSYDMWRFLYREPFVIQLGLPLKTKYYDSRLFTKTAKYSEITDSDKDIVVRFLQGNYIDSELIMVDISREELDSEIMTGSYPSFITVYYGMTPSKMRGDIIGCISSKTIQLFFLKRNPNSEISSAIAYMFDHVCVHREHTKLDSNIGRVLFQTHEFKQRTFNNSVKISIFKKEVNLCEGIVPLVEFQTFTFHIPFSSKVLLDESSKFRMPKKFIIVRALIDNKNVISELLNTVSSLENGLLFCAAMDESNIIAMISAKTLFVFALKKKGKIFGVYCFRDMHTQYDEMEGSTVSLVASFCNTDSGELFFTGFVHALRELITFQRKFKVISIDGLGSNCIIVEHWARIRTPIFSTIAAYYLYNFVHPNSPLDNRRCFMLT